MKKLVTIATLALCAALAACVFMGCAGNAQSNNQSTTSSSASKVKESEKTELKFITCGATSRVLAELQQLYAQTHETITFADPLVVSAEGDMAGLIKNSAAPAQTDSSSSASSSSASASSTSADSKSGAPLDGVITFSKGQMDALERAELIVPATRFDLARDRLVIVTAKDNGDIELCSLDDIAHGAFTTAIGGGTVPSGMSARQALSTVGCYADPTGATGVAAAGEGGNYVGALAEAGKLIEKPDSASLCTAIQKGEAEVGLVYESDVYRFGSLKVIGAVDAALYSPVVYPTAVLAASEHPDDVKAFLIWCASDTEARKIFQKWGFEF